VRSTRHRPQATVARCTSAAAKVDAGVPVASNPEPLAWRRAGSAFWVVAMVRRHLRGFFAFMEMTDDGCRNRHAATIFA
jgi:hypothetical protein